MDNHFSTLYLLEYFNIESPGDLGIPPLKTLSPNPGMAPLWQVTGKILQHLRVGRWTRQKGLEIPP